MIVITGPMASGKTTALKVAESMGLRTYDADDWFKDCIKGTPEHRSMVKAYFDSDNEEHHIHRMKGTAWTSYSDALASMFLAHLIKTIGDYDVVAIPSACEHFYTSLPMTCETLRITQQKSRHMALARDKHRDTDVTDLLCQTQRYNEAIWCANGVEFDYTIRATLIDRQEFMEAVSHVFVKVFADRCKPYKGASAECKELLSQGLSTRGTKDTKA